MDPNSENLITLTEASKMTPYSSDYLGLLVRKGRLEGVKKEGKWYTEKWVVEKYLNDAAEASYEHQKNLNVKVPEAEIKKAEVNFRWAIILLAVIIFGGLIIWAISGSRKNVLPQDQFTVVKDADNNLTIYVDNPEEIKSVKVMKAE